MAAGQPRQRRQLPLPDLQVAGPVHPSPIHSIVRCLSAIERQTTHGRPVPAPPRHRPRLVGGLVPRGPAPGDLGRLPRRDRAGGLRLHRAGSAGLHASGPEPAERGARATRPHGLRRHGFRGSAQGRGRAGEGEGGVRPGGEAARRGRRGVPRPPARAVHRPAHRRVHAGCATSTPSSGRTWSPAPTSWPGSSSRSTASSWSSTRTPTPTSTPRSGSSGSSATPTRSW